MTQILPPLTPVTIAPGTPEPRPTPLAGDVVGSTLSNTVVKVEGNPFEAASYGASQDGYALTWINANSEWQAKPMPIGFTAGGDLSGTATVQRVSQLTGVISLEQYGAIGDGVTDDTAAWLAAFAALSTTIGSGNHTIQLAANRTYLVSTGATLPANCSIIGHGPSSIIKTVSTISVITIGGTNISLSNFGITGNIGAYSTIEQIGISNNISFSRVYLNEVYFRNLVIGYNGYISSEVFVDPIITGCIATECSTGFKFDTQEYTSIANCYARGCYDIGFHIASGNIDIVGGGAVSCNVGIKITTSGNDAHGIVSGMQINHNSFPVYVDATLSPITNGHTFVGCHIYYGNIWLDACKGIKFADCTLDINNYYFKGSIGTIFTDCRFPMANPNTILNNYNAQASTTFWNNCRDINGNVPAFILAGQDGTNWQNKIDGYISLGASPTSSGLIKLEDLVTNSGTGATLTIQGQNETGTTSIGGNLVLQSGTGTLVTEFSRTQGGDVFIYGYRHAIGIDGTTIASGVNSFALGYDSQATSTYAISIGAHCRSGGGGSFAAGESCIASNNNSVAIGWSNTSAAYGSACVGMYLQATADAEGAFVCGVSGVARLPGEFNHTSGLLSKVGFTNQGNRALDLYTRATATTANAKMRLGAELTLQPYCLSTIRIKISAGTTSFGKVAAQEALVLVQTTGGSASTIIGSVTWTTIGQTFASQGWSVTISIPSGNIFRIACNSGTDDVEFFARAEIMDQAL
jgi:hypothetical protein